MPSIRWDQTKPAGGDSIGIGDEEIRSTKTALQVALDAEHVFPSAGGDAGVHRLGSARPYFGVQSAVSSTGTDGRLMQASDTSRLFGVGSGGTTYIGGPTAISAATFPGALPQRHIWVEEWGQAATLAGSAATTISFPNSGFSGVPNFQLTQFDNFAGAAGIVAMPILTALSATAFSVICFDVTGENAGNASGSAHSFIWRSVGSRVL